MKKEPLISIIIATYNSERTLEKTLISVFKQKFKNYEVVIVDGLSKDKTSQIIKKYKNKISVFIEEKDDGIYDAMNKGAKEASGKFLYFLNSDDQFYDDDVLKDLSEFYKTNSRADLITANVLKVYSAFSVLKNNRFSAKNLSKGIMPPHQGIFVKKEIFDKLKGFNKVFISSGDFDFCCKLLSLDLNVFYFDRVIAFFTAGGQSSNKKIAYKETTNVLKKYFKKKNSRIYFFKKVVLEQNIKKLLYFFKLKRISDLGTKISMNVDKE